MSHTNRPAAMARGGAGDVHAADVALNPPTYATPPHASQLSSRGVTSDTPRDSSPHSVTCLAWRSCARGTLLGFARIHVQAWGLAINSVAVHESHGKQWVQLPSKPILDDQRELVRGPDGKIQYAKVVEFTRSHCGRSLPSGRNRRRRSVHREPPAHPRNFPRSCSFLRGPRRGYPTHTRITQKDKLK
jgi:hypothetical protein